ncbi:MAG: glycosyltransferase family 2 protein, partial [Actinomycetes bacterium]
RCDEGAQAPAGAQIGSKGLEGLTVENEPRRGEVSVVIPNWNGMRWLDGVLGSLERQSRRPLETIVVDNGSTDGSVDHLARRWPHVRVESWPENRGFAAAANGGIALATGELVALVNSDIELEPDWLERTREVLIANPGAASVATKMVDLVDPSLIYDTGDFLRRDGATEQRGRFRVDDGRFDSPGEVWSACAGAALYRGSAVTGVGGFDERLFTYLEDVELGLRLRQAGWRCLYEPAVARHAGGGSERALSGGATLWVERNTIAIVASHFPPRWLGPVLYRQAAWAWHHFRAGTLRSWLRGLRSGLALVPALARDRRSRPQPKVPIDQVIPNRPWRGPSAGGHPDSPE